MKYQWIIDYCKSKPAAHSEYQPEWQATKLMISDKMFAMLGEDNQGRDILTVKLEPEHGVQCREQYAGVIIPGYYMNKLHWNSILLASDLSQDFIKMLIDEAYQLILVGFSKKRQTELLAK